MVTRILALSLLIGGLALVGCGTVAAGDDAKPPTGSSTCFTIHTHAVQNCDKLYLLDKDKKLLDNCKNIAKVTSVFCNLGYK